MARADLVLNLVKTGIDGDRELFRKTVEAVAAEERSKKHYVLADRLTALLGKSVTPPTSGVSSYSELNDSYYQITPRKSLDDLVLPTDIKATCNELVEEHHRRDLLRSYNLEPRHKVLLSGPPGNGKTSLAEAIAHSLMVPMFSVRYEGIIGSYLGETSKSLYRMFEHIKTHRCVLFFDEFDAIGKERSDSNDTGEVKRIVNSLLMQIDLLPSHVVVIAATNHDDMLDKAMWRRFQAQLHLPKPNQEMIEAWLVEFESNTGHSLGIPLPTLSTMLSGISFAELEELSLDIQRRYVLNLPGSNIKEIVSNRVSQWESRPQDSY